MKKETRPIALTMGDPSGISGEIVLKSWIQRKKKKIYPFFLIDDLNRLSDISKKMGNKVPLIKINDTSEVNQLFNTHLPILQIDYNVKSKLVKNFI